MMIRKRRVGAIVIEEEEEEEEKKMRERRQCVDVRRAERTRRTQFFFLGGYKFCGLFEKKREKKMRRESARKIEPAG